MKKNKVLLICVLLMLGLCSCGEEKPQEPEADLFVTLSQSVKDNVPPLTPSNLKDLDGNVLAKRITFEHIANSVCINTNHDTNENHTITICGKYLKTDHIDLLNERVTELIEGVSLYSEDNLIISSNTLEWNFIKEQKGVDFSVTFPIVEEFELEKPVQITRIAFDAGKTEFIKDCECFYLIPYNDNSEVANVIEGPKTPKEKIYRGSELKLSYYITLAGIDENKKIKADLLFPKDCKEYVEIKKVSIEQDDKKLKLLKNNTNIDQTLLQNKDVHVYRINVECKILKGFRIGFQPLIQLVIGNQEHIVAPFSLLDFLIH